MESELSFKVSGLIPVTYLPQQGSFKGIRAFSNRLSSLGSRIRTYDSGGTFYMQTMVLKKSEKGVTIREMEDMSKWI